ncbi:MAG: cell division ATP-binding protein FtsE [Bacteroidota bacterium]|jgi:cell division transport system ATP-binding protein
MTNTPVITLKDVHVFQQKNLVLSHVNLEIGKGEFVYLIGRTGSGKSSFLKLLYGELPLVQGSGSVVGFDLSQIKSKDIPFLRRKLGIVFQDFQLLPDRNTRDNLVFVLQATGWSDKSAINNKISDVLAKVGLETKGYKMPHELSGGEQQRLGIARALLNDPEVILADEPSGNLDPETSNGIMRLFFEISKGGCAIVMATHNYSLIERFPARVILFDQGKVSEQ